MSTQLAFRDTKFNVVTHNNQIWLTSKELAHALKYATANAVTALYNKNSDEFTDGMSQIVESTTSGNYRKKVRIFSLRGAHLIAMFARTTVAKEFRRWVLDILDREIVNTPSEVKTETPKESHPIVVCVRIKDRITGGTFELNIEAKSILSAVTGISTCFGFEPIRFKEVEVRRDLIKPIH